MTYKLKDKKVMFLYNPETNTYLAYWIKGNNFQDVRQFCQDLFARGIQNPIPASVFDAEIRQLCE